jgi:hypothetical protein
MSGRPQFNIPAFDAAARILRAQGWDIVSPAELDDSRIRSACLASPDGAPTADTHGGGTWGDFLSRDVKIVSDEVVGIILLDEWWTSRGARLEAFVGILCSKQFLRYYWEEEAVAATSANTVKCHLRCAL